MIKKLYDAGTRKADDVNYWRTSTTAPATWLDRAKKLISDSGGDVEREGFISEKRGAAYILAFSFGNDYYNVIWPVLAPRDTKHMSAARIQAATALYHEVKACCVKLKFVGARAAFFAYLMINGRPAAELAAPELVSAVPALLCLASDEGEMT